MRLSPLVHAGKCISRLLSSYLFSLTVIETKLYLPETLPLCSLRTSFPHRTRQINVRFVTLVGDSHCYVQFVEERSFPFYVTLIRSKALKCTGALQWILLLVRLLVASLVPKLTLANKMEASSLASLHIWKTLTN